MPAPHAVTPVKNTALLPVMVWIHGGSQAVTFGDSASKLCDPSQLVARSIHFGKPILVVNINYRLNIFAFGDETSEVNLALRDQRHALEYIKLHIAGFGGDPRNVTLAGESAGAVYTHAHMITKTPVRQCIMQSGTLHLSPPQSRETAIALIYKMSMKLLTAGNSSLRTAAVSKILEAQAALGLVSFYLQMEEDLQGWNERVGQHERVSQLKTMYGLLPDRPSSCKTGALDFLNDMRFTLPVRVVMEQRRRAQQAVFGYLMDQPNPWQRSSRAHHGVDLIYLFNGFDFTFDQSAQRVAEAMQLKWIEFICGDDPWKPGEFFTFGPFGESKEVDVADRRRYRHLDIAIALGQDKAEAIVRNLATGRSSLLN
ncbi:catalytic protein [Fusarium langsethiae]|uniref:Carboxylic ester hydrolase n=1 Tax=Fusarium langsethiae TaxID=179993 RepID=A0A0N0DCV4_FUSLA|nr:catalytic protein [Fusarium langsethiae]